MLIALQTIELALAIIANLAQILSIVCPYICEDHILRHLLLS